MLLKGKFIALLAPADGTALAANTHAAKPVLSIGNVRGTAVRKGAVLKASLPKKGKVTLAIGGENVACTSSSIAAKVVKNPAKAGEATLSVTSVSVAKCGKVDGFSLSLKTIFTPYGTTIKAAKGFPVTLSEAKKSKPMGFKVTVLSGTKVAAVCVFTAASTSGRASNKGNTVAFSKQPFTLNKTLTGSDYSTCSFVGTKSTFTATYGPIVDSSVKHSPKVFIN
jgi:hypothetical protein